jgi:hypothetical protein
MFVSVSLDDVLFLLARCAAKGGEQHDTEAEVGNWSLKSTAPPLATYRANKNTTYQDSLI